MKIGIEKELRDRVDLFLCSTSDRYDRLDLLLMNRFLQPLKHQGNLVCIGSKELLML